MKTLRVLLGLLGIILVLTSGVFTPKSVYSQADEEAVLRAAVEKNFKGLEDENFDMAMDPVHTQSPGYLATKKLTTQLFENYDLKYELQHFKLIGIDGEYAVCRGKQKTTKISGPAFQNNIVDVIFVFKKEKGAWKFWSQSMLEAKFID